MKVLVDTPVWSAAYRRGADGEIADALRELIAEGRCALPGVVRQEVLQGIRATHQFDLVRRDLDEFPDLEVWATDHVRAAQMFNRCKSRGVTPTTIDMLICALSQRHKAPIFTLDRDFAGYARVLGVKLYGPALH
jgi:predicted nucleic acid-binding protein